MQLSREYRPDEQRCVRALLVLLEAIAKKDNHAAGDACQAERRRGETEVPREQHAPS